MIEFKLKDLSWNLKQEGVGAECTCRFWCIFINDIEIATIEWLDSHSDIYYGATQFSYYEGRELCQNDSVEYDSFEQANEGILEIMNKYVNKLIAGVSNE